MSHATGPLPPGFTLRAPTWDDLEAVAALTNIIEEDDTGRALMSLADLRESWQLPDMTLPTDAWLVTAPDGQVAGYGRIWLGTPITSLTNRVHPSFRRRGIGGLLLRQIVRRAREFAAALDTPEPLRVHATTNPERTAGRHLLERAGFVWVRRFWRMAIALHESPPAPIWPAGISLVPFVAGRDVRAVYDATEEAFRDHWGDLTPPFEEWRQHMLGRERFDPSLLFVARDGEEVAAVAYCAADEERGRGWIHEFSVRRAWRRRGLGLALLHHAFGAFYRRALREVRLGVDATNPTGATHLYQRAGMTAASAWDTYEKLVHGSPSIAYH